MTGRSTSRASALFAAVFAAASLAPAASAFADVLPDALGPLRQSVGLELPRVMAAAAALDPAWYVAPMNGRNGFLLLHLVGLSLGFGATLVLDAMLMHWMVAGRPTRDFVAIFHTLMRAVSVGLALLWISGLGFLALYALFDPSKLANPKLHAKICLVLLLTLNGIVLHRRVLPLVLADVTRPLLDGVGTAARVVALLCGAVSAASWTFAILLGALRELNGRAGVFQVLPVWLAFVLLALAVSSVVLRRARRRGLNATAAGPSGPAAVLHNPV